MHTLYDVPAPAKLNLFLHVVGRRPDGYHLLQSAFMLIDWCDVLHFERRQDAAITREDLGASLPEDDLIVRAARALQLATGCRQGVHVGVQKNIPSQAGMGGGSSDAASTLLALNRLWQLGLNRHELMRIGLPLGADIPFFLHGSHGWVEGIGERIRTLELPSARFVVLKPLQGINTAEIFGSAHLKRDTPPAILSDFAADPYNFGCNDLQAVAGQVCPDLVLALNWLSDRGLSGRMTGSGSAVFANLPVGGVCEWRDLPSGWMMRLCGGLESHPLLEWALE